MDRVNLWARSKAARLQSEQALKAQDELKECTFTPKISATPSATSPAAAAPSTTSRDIASPYVGASSPAAASQVAPGFDEFLERQMKARKQREEKEHSFVSGDNWKPRKTTPKEPKLGRGSHQVEVPALKRVEPFYHWEYFLIFLYSL